MKKLLIITSISVIFLFAFLPLIPDLPLPRSITNHFQIPLSYASGPTTIGTTTSSGALPTNIAGLAIWYANGKYWAFYFDGTNIVWRTSSDSVTWSSATTMVAGGDNHFGIWIDGSNNVYYARGGIGQSSFKSRYGTANSDGTITWTISEVTVTPSGLAGTIYGVTISATSPTDIWVGLFSTTTSEVYYCATTCGTNTNWNNMKTLAASQSLQIVPLSTTAKKSVVYGPNSASGLNIITTSNSGSSWSGAVATAGSYEFQYSDCIGISDTTYCAATDLGAAKHVFLAKLAIGAGSWTEVTVATEASTVNLASITYLAPSSTLYIADVVSTTNINYYSSTNSGATWSGSTSLGTDTNIVQGGAALAIQGASSEIDFIYQQGSMSPWNVKFVSAVFTVTIPFDCIVKNTVTGTPTNKNVTFTGGSPTPSPSSAKCTQAGTTTNIVVAAGATITATVPSNATNYAYVFKGAVLTNATAACASGTCSTWIQTIYPQAKVNWSMTPTNPTDWDGVYSKTPLASNGGTAGTARCTITTVNEGGKAFCVGWADNNTATTLPQNFASTEVTATWQTATFSFTSLNGSSFNSNYILGYSNNFLYSLLYGGTIGTVTMTCNQGGSPASLVLTTVAQAFICDPGVSASVNSPIAGAAGEQFITNTSSYTVPGSPGGSTFTFVYVHQYQLAMSVSGPGVATPTTQYWDATNVVTIKATANPGSAFAGWTGTGTGSFTGTPATATVTMSASLTELATFNSIGSVTVSLTLTDANDAVKVNSTNYFLVAYFSGGSATSVHYVGSNPLVFAADGNTKFNITSPSQSSGALQRWCLSSGCSKFRSPTLPIGGSSSYSYNYYHQDNVTFYFTQPNACPSCSGQVPTITYVTFGNSTKSAISTTPTTYWLDNFTSWSTPLNFFYNTQYWTPSPSGFQILKPQVIDIKFTQGTSLTRCLATNDPLQNLYSGCWLDAAILTYGNLISVPWFLGIVIMEICGMLYLKNGNVGTVILVFMIGVALTGVGANQVLGANTLPGPVQIFGVAVSALGVAGIIYKVFAGPRGG